MPTRSALAQGQVRKRRSAHDNGQAQGTRNRAPMRPQPHRFVAQTEIDRAVTIPWIKARATGALAGLLACGS